MPDRDEMQAELTYLRSELGLVAENEDIAALRRGLGVREQVARIVLALKSGRLLTPQQIGDRLPSVFAEDRDDITLVRTLMCQARQQLGPNTIINEFGIGYRMTEAGRARVGELLAL